MSYPQELKLIITAEIRSGDYGFQSGLKFAEEVTLAPTDFLELCKILAAFHELAQKVQGSK
jgi:hypothetical protein